MDPLNAPVLHPPTRASHLTSLMKEKNEMKSVFFYVVSFFGDVWTDHLF